MDQRLSEPRETEIYRGNARLATEASRHGALVRLFTDRRFAVRVVRYLLGLPVPMETEDRRVLEGPIIDFFRAQPQCRRVLFVGCDWYTKHYERAYFRGTDFWTIDPLPRQMRFGASQHITAPLQDLAQYFPEATIDLIVCNGVYGFGLDSRQACEDAFEQCHRRLVPGGYLIVGWDDIPARDPVPLSEISALNRFTKFQFPKFGTWRYLTDTSYRHTYDFYRK